MPDSSPEFVWGLLSRGTGFVLFCAFVSIAVQVQAEAGRFAGVPVARKLATIKRDFPGWRRWAYFPTLLWLGHGDAALRAFAWGGAASALLVIYGGPLTFWARLACYLCYLSFDVAIGLAFPWECLLFEASVLALFVPATHALPDLSAVAAPAPALAWAYRLLLCRVMLGFGKQKFVGSNLKDLVYLKSFLINQPLPSPIGWYAQKLPAWLLRFPLLYMMAVELVVPFFMFVPGRLSVIAAVTTALLQVGIQLSGNFGFFNLLSLVLCLPLLDNGTPAALQLGTLFDSGAQVITNAFVALHTLAAVLVFPLNSWVGMTWTRLPGWYQQPAWVQWLVRAMRALHPLRTFHPYGVFAPHNQPGVKLSLLVEASWDRKQWHELEFRYSSSNARSAPRFAAPHHPRGDQSTVYETFGVNATSFISNMVGIWFDPYAFGAPSAASIIAHRILLGRADDLVHEVNGAAHEGPPLAVRMNVVMLEPASLRERFTTGAWWKRSHLGPHMPPRELDPFFDEELLPEPELWHMEAICWRERCPMIRELMQRARKDDADPMQLVLFGADGLSGADVARFWDELVPLIASHARRHFDEVADSVEAVHARFDRREQRALHRVLSRFTLILLARWEPLYLGRRKPPIAAESYFDLCLLAHHVIGKGRAAYLEMFRAPMRANAELAELTPLSGMYYLSVFRFESLVMDAQKMRMLYTLMPPYEQLTRKGTVEKPDPASAQQWDASSKLMKLVSGYVAFLPLLRDNFKGPRFDLGYAETQPRFRELPSGEIIVPEQAIARQALAKDRAEEESAGTMPLG
jgi:hypothetical protein